MSTPSLNPGALQPAFDRFRAMNLDLDMQRGQPSDENFALARGLFTIVGPDDAVTPSGVDIRNYPGGVAGLPEARALFAELLGAAPQGLASYTYSTSATRVISEWKVENDSNPAVTNPIAETVKLC